MPCYGHQVELVMRHGHSDFADRLSRIAMHESARPVCQTRDFTNGLQAARLAVGMHDRHQRRCLRNHFFDFLDPDATAAPNAAEGTKVSGTAKVTTRLLPKTSLVQRYFQSKVVSLSEVLIR